MVPKPARGTKPRRRKIQVNVGQALPLSPDHLAAVFEHMELSPQQAKVVELMLLDYSNKQIAREMGIAEPTIKGYQQRIKFYTGACGRMQLAMHVLAVSHEVKWRPKRRPKG